MREIAQHLASARRCAMVMCYGHGRLL